VVLRGSRWCGRQALQQAGSGAGGRKGKRMAAGSNAAVYAGGRGGAVQ